MIVELPTPAATEALGRDIASVLAAGDHGLLMTLAGELGAGKTALVRAILVALGHEGVVVSPSYTLIEPYSIEARQVFHLDLYRLGDAEELEYLGVRDLRPERDWIFVEWAERGQGYLPPPDIALDLTYLADGRQAELSARSAFGRELLTKLQRLESIASTT